MTERLELEIENNTPALAAAAARLGDFLETKGLGGRPRYAAELVLEELVGNAIRYGWDDDGPHLIRFTADADEQELRLGIEDDGRAFDPSLAPEQAPPDSVKEARIGGLGIQMVRRSVGSINYRRSDGRNHLDIVIPRVR